MRLNYDCVRDVLLILESKGLGVQTKATQLAEELKDKYSYDDVIYTVKKLFEDNLVSGNQSEGRHSAGTVKEITMKGHRFIDNIRSPKVWKEVTEAANSVGSVSLEILVNVASSVVTRLLSNILGIQ